ncbi:MAG: hypothetical protein WKG01_41130 [Kofleriaceae bacterium]
MASTSARITPAIAPRRPLERAQQEPQRGHRERQAEAVLDELDRQVHRARAARREQRGDQAHAPRSAEPSPGAIAREREQRAEQRGAELCADDRIGRRGERRHQPEGERRGWVAERAGLEQRAHLDRIEIAVDADRKRRARQHVPALRERPRGEPDEDHRDRDWLELSARASHRAI